MKEQDELANIPVIFVSGEHDAGTEEEGLSLGAVDYIKKPFVAAIVEAKVQNHIELKSYRDNLEILVSERTQQLEEYSKALEHRTKELAKRTAQLAASRDTIIMGMSLMSECHDSVTGKHIKRIKSFTEALVRQLHVLFPDLITPELGSKLYSFLRYTTWVRLLFPIIFKKKQESLPMTKLVLCNRIRLMVRNCSEKRSIFLWSVMMKMIYAWRLKSRCIIMRNMTALVIRMD